MTQRKTTEDFIRDGFESWCITGSRFFPVTQALNGDYFNALTNEAWKAWRAALDWQETQAYGVHWKLHVKEAKRLKSEGYDVY